MYIEPSEIKFLTYKDLMPIFGSRSTIDRMRVERSLPIPLNPHGQRVIWPEHEINQIKLFIAAGLNASELKEKIIQIEAARKNLLTQKKPA